MAGKFRQPISLERMQTAPNLTFVERAYPAMMAPNRDIGVMLHGAVSYPGYKVQYSPQPVFKEFLGYEVGIFNGIRDNQTVQNSDTEQDNNKEFAARLFMRPSLHSGSLLEGLGIGIAGTWGRPKNNALSALSVQVSKQYSATSLLLPLHPRSLHPATPSASIRKCTGTMGLSACWANTCCHRSNYTAPEPAQPI